MSTDVTHGDAAAVSLRQATGGAMQQPLFPVNHEEIREVAGVDAAAASLVPKTLQLSSIQEIV